MRRRWRAVRRSAAGAAAGRGPPSPVVRVGEVDDPPVELQHVARVETAEAGVHDDLEAPLLAGDLQQRVHDGVEQLGLDQLAVEGAGHRHLRGLALQGHEARRAELAAVQRGQVRRHRRDGRGPGRASSSRVARRPASVIGVPPRFVVHTLVHRCGLRRTGRRTERNLPGAQRARAPGVVPAQRPRSVPRASPQGRRRSETVEGSPRCAAIREHSRGSAARPGHPRGADTLGRDRARGFDPPPQVTYFRAVVPAPAGCPQSPEDR